MNNDDDDSAQQACFGIGPPTPNGAEATQYCYLFRFRLEATTLYISYSTLRDLAPIRTYRYRQTALASRFRCASLCCAFPTRRRSPRR